MRVIAGAYRGRPLRAPAGVVTRPTADRVREAIFDVLQSEVALEDAAVVDLFAGSGALGIEALSRGAASAVFVERHRAALSVIEANLRSLGLEDRASVVRAEVLGWLERAGAGRSRFDLALCDPPYDFDSWRALLSRLDAEVAVLESSRPLAMPGRWRVVRSKRYGGTLVTVVRHDSDGPRAGTSSPDGTARHSGTPDQKGIS